MGWECPVCHKGNAPSTPKCLHCAEATPPAPTLLDPKKLEDLLKPQPCWPSVPGPLYGPGDPPLKYEVTCSSPHRAPEFVARNEAGG